MDPADLDAALETLLEEQRRLARLRSDYDIVRRSRFFALHQMRIAVKQLFGANQTQLPIASSLPLTVPAVRKHNRASVARLYDAWATRAASRPENEAPVVSIVIPVFNNLDVTVRCLQSIADTWFETMNVQVILVDDESQDETPHVLAALPGIDYIRNGQNAGFVHSCNRGAAIARGRYICFLNNDTVVTDGWLDHLVTLAESDKRVGAVGSKLVYPDGRLQEAGGIIFADGNGWNYGRFDPPSDARYNYVREVDYCSGAALMVRTALFREIGGFSDVFAPAYYEDVDLCFEIRARGYRVLYAPQSEVVHFEGLTSGTDVGSGVKRFQEINKPKFVEKWSGALRQHLQHDPSVVPLAARRLRGGRTVLVVDSYVPLYDKEAGSLRLKLILDILLEAKYNVVFLPDNYAALQPYTRELQSRGVEVLHHIHGGRTMAAALDTVLPILDYAWICRPHLFMKYAELVKRNSATRLIYDTIDLHFVRKQRELALQGVDDEISWREIEAEELAAARAAHATVTVTEDERLVLEERGIENVFVVPTLHEVEPPSPYAYSEREGILFIGSYAHGPNADAAMFLCKQIMPLVWKRNPNVTLTLLGNSPPQEVLDLKSDRVRVPGYVADVGPYFQRSRIFAAPLRFGAGMKGKIGQSLSYGLPVVTTPVGAEGFDLVDGVNCRIANSAEDLAAAILSIYNERETWERLASASGDVIRPLSRAVVGPRILNMFESLAISRLRAARS